MKLGVNIDHIATLRQARGTRYPDPLYAGLIAEAAGADLITVHLREDRRHIQERDVHLLREALQIRLNLEMAVEPRMIEFACAVKPSDCCLVPEKRAELTTEGGLDVVGQMDRVRAAVHRLTAEGIRVSLFIDPDQSQIDAAIATGAPVIELHTGRYANAPEGHDQSRELEVLREAVDYACERGLQVNAGHGLNYLNVAPVVAFTRIAELNIGHAIVARSVFEGLSSAVREMKQLICPECR